MLSSVNDCFSSVSYLLQDHIIVDPGDIKTCYSKIDIVLLTHAHFDHIYGLNELLSAAPQTEVFTNDIGRAMLLDAKKNLSFYHETPFVFEFPDNIIIVQDGEEIDLGNGLTAQAVFTPGHNPSCITWIVGDALFTGDTYIPGVKTVTNLPSGNKKQAEQSVKIIKELAIGKTIYPGHKLCMD